jgi:8-amino-7-oxononanoate synthase
MIAMDILEKCFAFNGVEETKARGAYFFFRELDSPQGPLVTLNGRRMIMIGSNNYLGLTTHPRIKAAAIHAIETYGSGCAGSRFLNGNLVIHEALEKKLAAFVRKEAAVVFATGYQANLGGISSLVDRHDLVVLDQYDHASIFDGCRLSFGRVVKFRHNDMNDLERILRSEPGRAKLVVVDGVFSMEGDIARLPEVVDLAQKYGARIFLDDAHGIGVLGKNGRGTEEHFGIDDGVDLVMGTFSKSFAAVGGFVAGPRKVVSWIKHFGRSQIFSASLPPVLVAVVSECLDVLQEEPQLRQKLWDNTRKMREGFQELGLDTGESETPVIPVLVGDPERVYGMCRALSDRGVFVNPVISPAVPPGRELLRTSYMATHTEEQLDTVLEAFAEAAPTVGLI